MKRALLFLLLLGLVTAAVVWVAERPGSFTIVWQGWRIDAPIGFLLGGVALLAAAGVATYALLGWLTRLPGDLTRWRRERRRRRGYRALTGGLVAVAAGDPREARRQARRAAVLLDEPPLTLLLSAQAAQLAEDERGARQHFHAMLARPETEFLGLRGLLTQALRAGNDREALVLARRARALQPDTPWVLTTLFDLEARAGDWDAAIATIRRAARIGALPPARARRAEAAALVERSRTARQRGRKDEALRFAKQAYAIEAQHPAAASTLALALVETGGERKAAKLIEQEWARKPHPALVPVYRRATGASDPLEWTRRVDALAKLAPEAPESRIAAGHAAIEARLWGEARRHLSEALADGPPTAGVARMMARIEAGENGDAAAERRWLAQAAEAAPDPAWVCEACGFAHREWQAGCGRCRAFDRLVWRSPDRVQPLFYDSDAPASAMPPPPSALPVPLTIAPAPR